MADEAREISSKLGDIAVLQARMDGKLDILSASKDDHEKRLRALEAWRFLQLGAALAAGTGGGALVKLLSGGGG